MVEIARPAASVARFGRSVWAWPIAAGLLAAWPVWRSLFPETRDIGVPPMTGQVALAAAEVILCGFWVAHYRHRIVAFHLPLFAIGFAAIVGVMAGAHGDILVADLAALAICWLVAGLLFAGAVLLDGQRAFASAQGGPVPPVGLLLRRHERLGYWLFGIALVAAGLEEAPTGFLLAAIAVASPGAIVSWAALCDTARNVLGRRRAYVGDLAGLPALAANKRILLDPGILIARWPKLISIMPAGAAKPGEVVAIAAALLAEDNGAWGHAVQDFGVTHRVRVPTAKPLESRAPALRRAKLPDRRMAEVGPVADCTVDAESLAPFAEGIARAEELHRVVLAVVEAEPLPRLLGLLVLAKVVRPGAAETVRSLRKSGFDLGLTHDDGAPEDKDALAGLGLAVDAGAASRSDIAVVLPGAARLEGAAVTIRFGGAIGPAAEQAADIVIAREDPRTLVDLLRFARDFRRRVALALALSSLPGIVLLSAVFGSVAVSPFLITGVAVAGVALAAAAPQVLRLSPAIANEVDEE